jgi:hypothetical protein
MKYWKRPLAFTVAVYALLIWVWVLVRNCDLGSPFIDGIPITQWETALIAFLVSAGGFYYALAT